MDKADTQNNGTANYDADTQRALHLFVVLTRCYNSVSEQARKDIAQYDLSVSEFAALELLYHKGPTPLGCIAEQVLLTSGRMTYVIDQLAKQGFVKRVHCPEDRRKLYAELTETGHAKIAAIFPGHAERLRQVMAALMPQEQEIALKLLKQLGLSLTSGAKVTTGISKPDDSLSDPLTSCTHFQFEL